MKRIVAIVSLTVCAGSLLGCGPAGTDGPVEVATAETPSAPTSQPRPTPESGTPEFVALIPGAEVEAPATTASGPNGRGGMVVYKTDADPEAVIKFHKGRAEAAGLSSVMAMNHGDARAYSAKKDGTGEDLQVVAAPTEDGRTSVQLTWSEGA